jgi:hypothetical protein
MDEKHARALISISDGRVEFEGSEEFVERQLTAYGDLIKDSLRILPITIKRTPAERVQKPEGEEAAAPSSGLAGLELVLAKTPQGKIQILKDLPGVAKAEKMVNAALLLTLANTLDGRPSTTFKEIREICEAHGALDSSNFSTTVREQIANFLFEGSGSSTSISFTVPGRRVADALAASLNQ